MKVREALEKIQTELIAPKSQKNTFGNYNFRSCEDILKAVKPHLKECNCILTITDELVVSNALETEIIIVAKTPREVQTQRVYIKAIATISDVDGESISTSGFARESSLKTGMDSSQLTGATSSYARKYALNGLFAIDDTKDSDSTNKHGKEEVETSTKPDVGMPEKKTTTQTTEKKENPELLVCSKCQEEIKKNVYDYSMGKFNKPLCFDCQKKVK